MNKYTFVTLVKCILRNQLRQATTVYGEGFSSFQVAFLSELGIVQREEVQSGDTINRSLVGVFTQEEFVCEPMSKRLM
jgi:hypothetical protein